MGIKVCVYHGIVASIKLDSTYKALEQYLAQSKHVIAAGITVIIIIKT